MPRPREFDEDVALEAAMRRFWADGFAATSVRDLGDAMGLGQASVYNAFGDKRALFTQCLDRYLDANMRARIARVEKSLPPRQAIETFLRSNYTYTLTPSDPRERRTSAADGSATGAGWAGGGGKPASTARS